MLKYVIANNLEILLLNVELTNIAHYCQLTKRYHQQSYRTLFKKRINQSFSTFCVFDTFTDAKEKLNEFLGNIIDKLITKIKRVQDDQKHLLILTNAYLEEDLQ